MGIIVDDNLDVLEPTKLGNIQNGPRLREENKEKGKKN